MKYEQAKAVFQQALDNQQTISIKKLRKLMQVMNMSLQPIKDAEITYLKGEINRLNKRLKRKGR